MAYAKYAYGFGVEDVVVKALIQLFAVEYPLYDVISVHELPSELT